MRRNQKWTKEKIISEIQSLHSNGVVMAPSLVREVSPKLFNAAVRGKYFGSWRKALSASGFEPEREYAKYRTILRQKSPWRKAGILQQLIRMSPEELKTAYKTRPDLYSAARRRFGTWGGALEAAGRSGEESIFKMKLLSVDIKKFIDEHGDRQITRLNPRLYGRAYRMFGCWRRAVEYAKGNEG